jgi:hypothetical protein
MRGRDALSRFYKKTKEPVNKSIHNFRIWTIALLAVLLLTGCHDYEADLQVEQPVDILSRFNTEGKAWLTLQIPMSSRTTRATSFDDGSADEFKVRNVHILVFAGADEATATFASAYEVVPTLGSSTDEQITTTATVSISDNNISSGDKLFVLVVLNNNTSAITTNTFPATNVTFANANGLPLTLTGGTSTISALDNVTVSLLKDSGGYFMMTNARLADDNTTSAGLFTLVGMDASYFFSTEEESLANPPVHISVERLTAKTTVENGMGDGSHQIAGNSYATFENTDLSFALDNYNVTSYLCRHLDAVGYERMVESNAIESFTPLAYRTYWGTDINYDSGSGLTYTNHANRNSINWLTLGSTTPMYCAENTFDVERMQDNCTTSVLVRLQLNNGGDFYTTNVTGSDVIFQPPMNDLKEEGTSASSSFVRKRSNLVTYDGTDIATIDDYLRQWLMEQSADLRAWVRDYAGNESKHLKITVSGDAETGLATATLSQTAQSSGAGYTAFEAIKPTLQGLLNGLTIKFYDDGYCYYRVLIRHFDDTQTPWSSTAEMSGNTTDKVYVATLPDTPDSKYLGRYGMVRNNWYNISINSVTHVGSPIIPPLTTNADDKVEQLLNATLRISGWEKHDQNL